MTQFNCTVEELPNGQLKFVVAMPESKSTDMELRAALDIKNLLTGFFDYQRQRQSESDLKEFSMSEMIQGFGGSTICAEFDTYLEKAYHGIPVSQAQRNEMRKGFYAGAAICFFFMRRTAESMDEEAAARELAGWEKEIKLFFTTIKLAP